MIRAPETEPRDRKLTTYLSDQVRAMQSEVRGLLDVAARRNSTASRIEDRIGNWEARIRIHAPKGQRWKVLLFELTQAISEASDLYRQVHEAESRALPLLGAWLEQVSIRPTGSEAMIPGEVVERLLASAELRASALSALERSLALASRIGVFTTRETACDVLELLDERRCTIAESEACRSRANTVERRAFRLDTDQVVDLEFAAEQALGTDDYEPSAMHPRSKPGADPFEDEEWEAWLRFVNDAPPTP